MHIIDAHCHYGKGDNLTEPALCRASLKEYVKRADKFGIRQTALWSVLHSDYRIANRQVAKMVAQYPDRFIGVMFVHAGKDAALLRHMAREFIGDCGFRAIKLHAFDAPITRPVCEIAKEYRVPIVYDLMGKLHQLEIFAREYPGVDFIIPHFGAFSGPWKIHTDMIHYLIQFPNVYTDTSSVQRFDILVDAVRRAGAQKIIYGSDGPWLHPGIELSKVMELPVSHNEKELIAGKNFLRLVGKRR